MDRSAGTVRGVNRQAARAPLPSGQRRSRSGSCSRSDGRHSAGLHHPDRQDLSGLGMTARVHQTVGVSVCLHRRHPGRRTQRSAAMPWSAHRLSLQDLQQTASGKPGAAQQTGWLLSEAPQQCSQCDQHDQREDRDSHGDDEDIKIGLAVRQAADCQKRDDGTVMRQ